MKKAMVFLVIAGIFATFTADAGGPSKGGASEVSPLGVIQKNIEIKKFVSAFEKNRNQKCTALTSDVNSSKGEGEVIGATAACNEYDKDGNAMANVHWIEFSGRFYGKFYVLDGLTVIPGE
ncbi:hypothetical protein D3C87_101920 [compost metagenome]